VSGAPGRILAMLLRYLYLHKRSLARLFEILLWPVMELFVWGFFTIYIRGMVPDASARILLFLISGMIFWEICVRSQQAVSISFMEEIWHQNIINILVTPLRIWEWVAATFLYGLIKTAVITAVLSVLAYACYRFNFIDGMGLLLFPLGGTLLLFGWIVGIFTAGILIRWGHSAEALIWGIPFLLQPFSAIYYPVSALPEFLRHLVVFLPGTHVFEGMRAVLAGEPLGAGRIALALALNFLFFVAAAFFFQRMYAAALKSGRLVRLGLD
jgi:ABC-2 type transport system permease protein